MKKIVAILAFFALVAQLAGCSNLADARNAKGTGVSREYPVEEGAVWKALPLVLKELNLPLVGENRQEGYMLAQRGITFASYGENVAIFIESRNGITRTRVEVVSKKAMATNIFAPDWSNEILDELENKLNFQKKSL